MNTKSKVLVSGGCIALAILVSAIVAIPQPADCEFLASQLKDLRDTFGPEDKNTLREIVDGDCDPNTTSKYGVPILVIASGKNCVDIVGTLLEKGADVNLLTPERVSALIIGSMAGSSDIVELLLNAGADIGHKLRGKFTALDAASYQGRTETVRLLLDDLSAKGLTVDGGHALILNTMENHRDVAKILVASDVVCADIPESQLVPLRISLGFPLGLVPDEWESTPSSQNKK